MPVEMFKHKQVHWEAMGRSAGRGRSVDGGGEFVVPKVGSDANECTAIEQLCICISVERDYTEG